MMAPRVMRLKKLQLVIDEQSPMRTKQDSLTFLVKRKPQEYYVLLNHQQMQRGWRTNATHVPFRDWCPICVSSSGRSSPHRRVVANKTADTLPKFQTDYMFIRTVAESKTQPRITFVETRSGVVISFMCARKGGYEDLTKEILRHFEAYGFLNPVILQCDTEMSIIDVCRKVARERNARTVLRSAAKNKSSEQRVCRSSARTHSGNSHDATRHTFETNTGIQLFSNFTCHSICNSFRWICSLKIHSATRRQNPHSNICLELHMYHLCACLVNRYSR